MLPRCAPVLVLDVAKRCDLLRNAGIGQQPAPGMAGRVVRIAGHDRRPRGGPARRHVAAEQLLPRRQPATADGGPPRPFQRRPHGRLVVGVGDERVFVRLRRRFGLALLSGHPWCPVNPWGTRIIILNRNDFKSRLPGRGVAIVQDAPSRRPQNSGHPTPAGGAIDGRHRQRGAPRGSPGMAGGHAAVRPARGLRADRRQVRLRTGPVRCLHRSPRRRPGAQLPRPCRGGRGTEGANRRRAGRSSCRTRPG